MSLAEPAYEAMSPKQKAAWHTVQGHAIRSHGVRTVHGRNGAGPFSHNVISEEAQHRAEKHYRVARRILWAAEMKQKPA